MIDIIHALCNSKNMADARSVGGVDAYDTLIDLESRGIVATEVLLVCKRHHHQVWSGRLCDAERTCRYERCHCVSKLSPLGEVRFGKGPSFKANFVGAMVYRDLSPVLRSMWTPPLMYRTLSDVQWKVLFASHIYDHAFERGLLAKLWAETLNAPQVKAYEREVLDASYGVERVLASKCKGGTLARTHELRENADLAREVRNAGFKLAASEAEVAKLKAMIRASVDAVKGAL